MMGKCGFSVVHVELHMQNRVVTRIEWVSCYIYNV